MNINDDGHLECPNCGSSYGTHVDRVSLVGSEGSPRITVESTGTVTVGEAPGYSRSSRAHWFEVHVGCEFCPGGDITFAQHKGWTLVTANGEAERLARVERVADTVEAWVRSQPYGNGSCADARRCIPNEDRNLFGLAADYLSEQSRVQTSEGHLYALTRRETVDA